MENELKRLYRAKNDYQYIDRLTRSQTDELADINRRIAVLEQVSYKTVERRKFSGPTLPDALNRIRMWGILLRNGFFKNFGNK